MRDSPQTNNSLNWWEQFVKEATEPDPLDISGALVSPSAKLGTFLGGLQIYLAVEKADFKSNH
jgi:hypothetical protein